MANAILSNKAFENLVKHLVELEDVKEKLLQEFFPKLTTERYEIEALIEKYVEHVDNLVRNANKLHSTNSEIPFVTIDSVVEMQDLSNQEVVYKYRVVYPFRRNINEDNISFLSPIGKSLLLKRVGDIIEVNAPGGLFRYEIKSIQFKN